MTLPSAAHAGQNLLSCDHPGGLMVTGCRVADTEIASRLEFHSRINVRYIYDCAGNSGDIVLSADEAEGGKELLVRSPWPSEATVTSLTPIHIRAREPRSFYRAAFFRPCRLEILSVQVSPSFTTLLQWQELQHAYVESLLGALLAWQEAHFLETMMRNRDARVKDLKLPFDAMLLLEIANGGFETTQILQPDGQLRPDNELPRSWHLFIRSHPLVAHILVARGIAESIARRQPIGVGSEEIAAIGREVGPSLVEHCGQILLAQMTHANTLLEKLTRWNQIIDERLRTLSARIRTSLQTDTASSEGLR